MSEAALDLYAEREISHCVEQTQLSFCWDGPVTEQSFLHDAVRDLSLKQANLRRGLFKRFDEISKELIRVKLELEELKAKNESHDGKSFQLRLEM